MTQPKPDAAKQIEAIAFDLATASRVVEPTEVTAAIAAHRDQVLTEAAEHLERIADQAEAKVAEHYGLASGIGPGSADMVREAAKSVRRLAARSAQTPQES